MNTYYSDGGITIYHGDSREWVGQADVGITDPPYDAHTHASARTNAKGPGGVITIPFEPFNVERDWHYLTQGVRRWTAAFCALEMLGAYQHHAAECYIRGCFWDLTDGTQQRSGDRPAQPGEGIALFHDKHRKSWNGGGRRGLYRCGVEREQRVHPTQKPMALMMALVFDFSNVGETIVDRYMGAGTTLVAAKRLGRKAIGIELEERWCEHAAKRLAQGTLDLFGQDPVILAGETGDLFAH